MAKFNLKPKPLVEVVTYLNITDTENPVPIVDEKELKQINEKEPHIFKITSKWKSITFKLANIIEMNQYIDKIITLPKQTPRIQQVFSTQARTLARIKVLLQDWNLGDVDDNLKLDFEPCIEDPKVQVLSTACMDRITTINPPSIMWALYNTACDLIFPEEAEFLKNLLGGNQTPPTE